MSGDVRLNLIGLDRLTPGVRAEIVVLMREVMGSLCTEAGKRLIITTGHNRGDLNLEFNSETVTTSGKDVCGVSILGEDAGEVVFVQAHKDLRVCGPVNTRNGTRDTRRILNAFWLLGPALAGTGIHELGHFIARLEHVDDASNYMSTIGPPVARRTMAVQRDFWAGKKRFTDEQRKRLVKQIREGTWLGDDDFTVTPVGP